MRPHETGPLSVALPFRPARRAFPSLLAGACSLVTTLLSATPGDLRADARVPCTLDLRATVPDALYRVGAYAWSPPSSVTLLRGIAQTQATAARTFALRILEADPGALIPGRDFLLVVSDDAADPARPDACRATLVGREGSPAWPDAILARVGSGFAVRVPREGSSSHERAELIFLFSR